ncbi:MAG: flagellar basal body L-ring protein FlgH [Gemmatimonadota bacterium]
MKHSLLLSALLAIGCLMPAALHAQSAESAGPPLRHSWTSDRIALREGDVITILIDEYTVASADRGETASRERGRDVSLSLGTGGSSLGGSLRTGNDVSSRTRGESSRRGRFSAELSARVVEVLPNGVLRLEAMRRLKIDNHEQDVTIRGFVRPEDVSSSNTVESWRIADAEILYTSNGKLGKVGGIWSKILDLILP